MAAGQRAEGEAAEQEAPHQRVLAGWIQRKHRAPLFVDGAGVGHVEVGVVAQHQHLTLPARQPKQRGHQVTAFAGGRWSRQPAPTQSGFTGAADDLTLIPGTTSVWGTGLLTATGNGPTEADIVKHGP